MTCEHCGAKVVDGGQTCDACGMTCTAVTPEPHQMAKVIPFRAKKRPTERTASTRPPKRRRSPVLWWIAAIIAVALVFPYLRF